MITIAEDEQDQTVRCVACDRTMVAEHKLPAVGILPEVWAFICPGCGAFERYEIKHGRLDLVRTVRG